VVRTEDEEGNGGKKMKAFLTTLAWRKSSRLKRASRSWAAWVI
jgi:hypothetical protein